MMSDAAYDLESYSSDGTTVTVYSSVGFDDCKYNDGDWCILLNEWCTDVDTSLIGPKEVDSRRCKKFNEKGGYVGYFYSVECRACAKGFDAPEVLRNRGGISDDMDDSVEFFVCDSCLAGGIDNSMNERISREVDRISRIAANNRIVL